MSSLANRATPSQRVVMRMIAGAVRNVAHAHPDWQLHPKAANSVAKRATGTLTAGWPAVLAASIAPSDGVPDSSNRASRSTIFQGGGRNGGSYPSEAASLSTTKGQRGGGKRYPAAPLRFLHGKIGAMTGEAQRAGDTARVETLREVLRLIGAELKAPR